LSTPFFGFPVRAVMSLGSLGHESYFKAADDNQFDLVYWPLAVSQDVDFDAAIRPWMIWRTCGFQA